MMVHGICSTPRHFDFLLPSIPDGISVHNLLLDGHGGEVQDFSRTSMKRWKEQVERCLRELCSRHSSVIIVGYSLGTLLTMELTKKYPQVKAMLLFNPPLHIHVRALMVPRVLRFSFGRTRMSDPVEAAMFEDISIRLTPLLWRYIPWISNFVALLRLSKKCRVIAPTLKLPCYVLFGEKDELVSVKSQKYFEGKPNVRCMVFEDSGHCYYTPEFRKQAVACMENLLNRQQRKEL